MSKTDIMLGQQNLGELSESALDFVKYIRSPSRIMVFNGGFFYCLANRTNLEMLHTQVWSKYQRLLVFYCKYLCLLW